MMSLHLVHSEDVPQLPLEFKIIWDTYFLVNIPDEYDLSNTAAIKQVIMKTFKTETGENLAMEKFHCNFSK